ncbi:uncharacterized protein LOC144917341 [Branchiostoma floridae x Branchiostoma belcheri]
MQLRPVEGSRQSWVLPLSLLCSLTVGAAQRHMTCGSEEFLQGGTCRPCPQCGDGEHLNAECGNGLGAEAECVPCPEGHYSNADTRHRCWPCTNCSWENKVQEWSCTPSHNAECGRCLEWYFQYTDLQCHHCSIEPTDLHCKDWLAQQTTTQPTTTTQTTTVWEQSSSTNIKPEPVNENYGQPYVDWRAYIPVIILAVILLIIVAAYIAKKWKTHENSPGEEPEKQDLEMTEQGTSATQLEGNNNQAHGKMDSSTVENEVGGTIDGAAVPPGEEGALCSSQESQNGQAAQGLKSFNFLADLTKKAAEATADMKLEDLDQDLREDLAMQLSPEPTVLAHKNWRHLAGYFNIDKIYIDYWKGQNLPMMHVFEHLEKSTHVTVAEIIDAIQSIGRVKVAERLCHRLLSEEYNDFDNA